MNKLKKLWLSILVASMLVMTVGCSGDTDPAQTQVETANTTIAESVVETETKQESTEVISEAQTEQETQISESNITLADIPEYSGEPYVIINNNAPEFTNSEFTTESFETYSELDDLGRCGTAYANIGQDLMPTEERGSIGQIKPTGWHTVKYDCVDGNYLYNRCHLIGYQLTAENANEQNLITGTRYLNTEGMLPFENMVADYIKETGNHVLYRVTPVFDSENLVASGVQIEAQSVEDNGDGIEFNVYCYNVQPGIEIDYVTGESQLIEDSAETTETTANNTPETTPVTAQETTASETTPETVLETTPETTTAAQTETSQQANTATYILNTNTHKFHLPGCSSVGQMNEENKQEYTGSRDDIIAQGYEPCKRCNP